jgi:hypothetical protein
MTKVLVILLLLALLPFPICYWLSAKDRHYDDVLRGIRDAQECKDQPCKLDFDGDAIPGLLKIDRASPAEYYDSWLVATENGHEILRLPYRYLDNTLRTHVGIRSAGNLTRLIVYDHMSFPGPPISAVFAWNGERLVQVYPSDEDQEVLKAMGARDDAGVFTIWAAYRTFRLPALTVYYILWGICAWLVIRRASGGNYRSNRSAEFQQ